jgi:hypothetical protein
MTSLQKQRFIVALNAAGRGQGLRDELLRVLEGDPRVSILEGRGRNAMTVLMTAQVGSELRERLTFATVAPAYKLQLLG